MCTMSNVRFEFVVISIGGSRISHQLSSIPYVSGLSIVLMIYYSSFGKLLLAVGFMLVAKFDRCSPLPSAAIIYLTRTSWTTLKASWSKMVAPTHFFWHRAFLRALPTHRIPQKDVQASSQQHKQPLKATKQCIRASPFIKRSPQQVWSPAPNLFLFTKICFSTLFIQTTFSTALFRFCKSSSSLLTTCNSYGRRARREFRKKISKHLGSSESTNQGYEAVNSGVAVLSVRVHPHHLFDEGSRPCTRKRLIQNCCAGSAVVVVAQGTSEILSYSSKWAHTNMRHDSCLNGTCFRLFCFWSRTIELCGAETLCSVKGVDLAFIRRIRMVSSEFQLLGFMKLRTINELQLQTRLHL